MRRLIYSLIIALFICNYAFAQNSIIEKDLQEVMNLKSDELISINIVFKAQMDTEKLRERIQELIVVEGKNDTATLKQYFTVFDDCDVIATHTEVINTCECPITVNKLMSLQLDFIALEAKISTFDGTWTNERTRHNTHLTGGRFEISSALGIELSLLV